MIKRIITTIIALPIFIFILLCGGLPLCIIITALALLAQTEFFRVVNNQKAMCYLSYFFTLLYAIYIYFFNKYSINIFLCVFMLSNLLFFIINHKKINLQSIFINIFAFFYITYLFYFIYFTRTNVNFGKYAVLLIFISAWSSDTGAYLIGKALGKHKLAPNLSPNKTIEGSIGGIIFAFIGGLIYAIILHEEFIYYGILCAICGIASQAGDLVASVIKRKTNIKDYGNILPGHGGILDRFDSILFSAPIVYIILQM